MIMIIIVFSNWMTKRVGQLFFMAKQSNMSLHLQTEINEMKLIFKSYFFIVQTGY